MDRYYNRFLSRAYVARVLNGLFFNPLSILLYTLVFSGLFYVVLSFKLLSWAILIVSTFLYFLFLLRSFVSERLRWADKKPIFNNNLADLIEFELGYNLVKHGNLSIYTLFQSAIETKSGVRILNRLGLDKKQILEQVQTFYTQNQQQSHTQDQITNDLLRILQDGTVKKLDAGLIFYYLFTRGGIFADILNKQNLSLEEFWKLIQWNEMEVAKEEWNHFQITEGLKRNFDSFGRNWALGYTLALDMVTEDISENILRQKEGEVIAHKDVLNSVAQSISGVRHKNALILGKNGVGKTTLVYNLAYLMRKYEKEHNLRYSRILKLKTTDLLFGNKDAENYLLKALSVAERSGDIIIYIESISTLLTAQNGNLNMVISRFLNSPRINVIGIESNENYHGLIKNNPAFNEFFDNFTLDDASKEDTFAILVKETQDMEKHSSIRFTFKALQSAIDLSGRYIGNQGFPGKAINIINEAFDVARNEGSQYVLETHVRAAIEKVAHINVSAVGGGEKTKLLELFNHLRQDVIGQDHALESIVGALKRAKLDLGQGHGPLGTFLFLGTTGVGKTETAKSLAKNYFGGEDKMIRLDMNEYSSPNSVYSIIGSESEEGFLTKKVQDNPFSLILLDEIEKAHKTVLNTFLQILDEGMMTDNRGIKTDFRNTIIIATSNAGATFIGDKIINEGITDKTVLKKMLLKELVESGLYSPEFLNRFNDILVFYPLDAKSAFMVAGKMIYGLEKEFAEQRGIQLMIDNQVVAYLSQLGYSAEYGAREMNRTIKDKLENYLADYLLTHDVARGQAIPITMNEINGQQNYQSYNPVY